MKYEKQINSLFNRYDRKNLYLELSKFYSDLKINKIDFISSCLNLLPTSSCCDFLIYNYKIFICYTEKQWLFLVRGLNEMGKYTLTYFLKSYTGFSIEELNKIGLKVEKNDEELKNEKLIINSNIKIISFKDSLFIFDTCKSLGLKEKQIKEMAGIRFNVSDKT